jgi:hypothetical protein
VFTSTTFAGPLGWSVTNGSINGIPSTTYWNAQMRGGDNAYLSNNPGPLIAKLTHGQKIPAYSYTNVAPIGPGTPPPTAIATIAPVDTLTTAALQAADLALQNADGPVAEWIVYSDDGLLANVSTHIAQLRAHVDVIHNFTRLNNAPRFLALYVPTGVFLSQQLTANPILASYPDGVVLQSQIWEDQPAGADPTYLATTCGLVNLVRMDAPTHPVNVQTQAYSKTTGQVWTEAKIESDIDALGATCHPDNINVWFNLAAEPIFSQVILHYRP